MLTMESSLGASFVVKHTERRPRAWEPLYRRLTAEECGNVHFSREIGTSIAGSVGVNNSPEKPLAERVG